LNIVLNTTPQPMESNLLLIPCAIESVATRRDKTLKVVIGTQELSPSKAAELFNQWTSGVGVMAFKGEAFNYNDEELLKSIKIDAEEMGSKTPSQRLRSCLYVLFERNPEGYQDFNSYYSAMMDKFIDMVKKRIDTYQL
jgi:hypothetical protein